METGQQVGTTGYVIAFTLKSDATQSFGDYTGSHIGQTLAIVLDKKVISAPTINAKIDKGSGYIEGNFTADSANALAIQLRYGSLPDPGQGGRKPDPSAPPWAPIRSAAA